MTMGPAPMIMMEEISVLFGMVLSRMCHPAAVGLRVEDSCFAQIDGGLGEWGAGRKGLCAGQRRMRFLAQKSRKILTQNFAGHVGRSLGAKSASDFAAFSASENAFCA
jgi:hypothetical protein